MAENQHAESGSPPQSDKDDFSTHVSEVEGQAVIAVSEAWTCLPLPGSPRPSIPRSPKSPGASSSLVQGRVLGSAGISVLMKTRDNLGGSIPFCVVADGPATHRPLTLLGINELMSVCRRLDDAVAKLTDG